MIYDVKSPARYLQQCGAMQCLIDIIHKELYSNSILVVTTKRYLSMYEEIWKANIEEYKSSPDDPGVAVRVLQVDSNITDVELQRGLVEKGYIYNDKPTYQTIVGVGGGSILDAVKVVSYQFPQCVLVPTILTNDGACTTMAVRKNTAIESMVYRMTNLINLVIVDPCVIIKTPYKMLLAGIADALSSYFEGALSLYENETLKVHNFTMTHADFPPDLFYTLDSYITHFMFVPFDELKATVESGTFSPPEWFENLIYYCFKMSGDLSENSSINVAHALATAIDTVYPDNKIMHGYKVAIGLSVQSKLTNHGAKYEDFTFKDYIPSTFKANGLNPTDEEIERLATITAQNKYVNNHVELILDAIKDVLKGES